MARVDAATPEWGAEGSEKVPVLHIGNGALKLGAVKLRAVDERMGEVAAEAARVDRSLLELFGGGHNGRVLTSSRHLVASESE